ncbi:SulP family inorganic anion transporter [Pseudodesulfovibrio sp.]|uniref:SulP family inorganic anion transporter n=1 Tax=Pseudodesulfovibrio sp. TaxID=2035812 RepID=UPI00261CC3C0|nr:SulP family inorganic anion transporter [Pseudodesulfovibrio sp.]MDD3310621.1 SulP family inorganic anion transporter [Pseudodesulfovibrio sp.]
MAVFKCDSCGYEREVPGSLTGKKAKCPQCGRGVVIVDEPSGGEPPAEPVLAEPESASRTEGASQPLNLDEAVAEPVYEVEDAVCAACGAVISGGHEGVCPSCGAEVREADEYPEITEDDVDVSDLAESREPQVWDDDFGGGDRGGSVLDRDDRQEDGWRLLAGGLPLNLFGGLVSGLLAFFFAVALAMLVVSQDSTDMLLPYVLAASLIGTVVGCVFYPFGSRIPFSMAGPGSVTAVVLIFFVGNISKVMAGFSPETVLVTLVAGLMAAAIFVGAVIWLLGRLRLGELIRYIPLQIIGGAIGGIGVFILLGMIDWGTGLPLSWSSAVTALSEGAARFDLRNAAYTLGPSLVFGLVLFLALSRYKNSLFLLAIIMVAAGAGFGAGLWGHDPVVKSLAAPLPGLTDGVIRFPWDSVRFDHAAVRWDVIKDNGLYIGALASLVILTVMYRITRLELLHGREVDLSREYRSLGLVNMLSGLCGGLPVAVSYGRSAGNHASGGRGALSVILAGLICAAGLAFAGYVLPLVPRFVFEGLLVYAGLDLIRDWMFKARSAFTRRDDFWLLWLTFLATVLLGLIEGLALALVLALLVTVGRNSRIGSVRNVLSGANHRSNVDRAAAQQRTLKEVGDHIHILRLQGFLFLGSMQRLILDIRHRLDDRDKLPVRFLLLDFRMVNGFASACGVGFEKLLGIMDDYGVEILITSAPLELETHLESMGCVGEAEGQFRVFFNLDFALEWCENRILDSENMLEMRSMSLAELLRPVFPEPKYIPALMKVLKRVDLPRGEAAFRQGDLSDSMYFVESGRLDVELELEGGKLLRLKKVGPGAVFGEMGLYTSAPRSATVRAAEKCVLYCMTKDKLSAVERRAPMLATAVNRYLINMMSDRLLDANVKVRDLMT